MPTINTQTTRGFEPDEPLNAIVAREPRALPVLQRFGLDTCCGGALPLSTAAAHHGLDIGELLAALRAAAGEGQP